MDRATDSEVRMIALVCELSEDTSGADLPFATHLAATSGGNIAWIAAKIGTSAGGRNRDADPLPGRRLRSRRD
jgi:hypothetical protein